MKVFYSPSMKGFYRTDVHKSFPKDCVDVPEEDYARLVNGQCGGHQIVPGDGGFPVLVRVVVTDDEIISTERSWRNSELSRVDIELYKVQDSDPKAKGYVGDWRNYRKALRAWPEHKDFPNKEKRPASPDA